MQPHPLFELANRTAGMLADGQVTFGLFLLSGNSMIAEAVATMPLDWLVVDMEASPVTKEGALHILQALNGSLVTPIIRVSALERSLIEHALDVGAQGVIIPKVDTPEDAARAAQACRFPPDGNRGINPVRASAYFGNLPRYLAGANQRTLCIVQIESAEAVECAADIAAVKGVDVLFMGMGDLSSSLGQPGEVTGPKMDTARQRVLAAAEKAGKIAGIFAYAIDLAEQYVKEGFRVIAISNEVKLLREGVMESARRLGRSV